MPATIRELSKRCGLSVSAVSKALNNYPDVSEATRKRVLKTAQEIGYYPNALARGLKTNRTLNVGVVLDGDTNNMLLQHFFTVLLNGFKHEVEKRGYDITLISRNIGGQRLSYLDHCRYRNVDGVCLMCVNFYDVQIAELALSDMPLVTIDHLFTGRDCVRSDNRAGMRGLMRYILGHGHRRIAFLHGNASSVTDVRVGAYWEVLHEMGISLPPGYVLETGYNNPRTCFDAVNKLLALTPRPTCILMSDDYAALGGIDAIRQAGLRIPEDISIAGFDGVSLIQKIHPRLTTYEQNGEEMGRLAAQKLISRIEDPKSPVEGPAVVSGTLLTGETVAQSQ